MKKKTLNTIILDFGGVLGLPHDPARELTMASLCRLPLGEFLSAYKRDRRELDMGILPTPEYWRRMLAVSGTPPTTQLLARLEREDTLAWTRINSAVVEWAAELRSAGYVTAVLSNMPAETVAYMRSRNDFLWLEDFAAAVFSCEVGAAKPDLPIYRLCMEKLGVDPAPCLFLDDSPVNVAGARAAGIPAEVFVPSAAAAFRLARVWDLPVDSLLDGLSAETGGIR